MLGDQLPYRLVLCLKEEADRSAALPAEVLTEFSSAERAQLLAIAPRRLRDRVAGRLAAKRALAHHFEAEAAWKPEHRELQIHNDPAGRPFLRLPPGEKSPVPSFSIAHCLEGAAAAVGAKGRKVGVDFELVTERPWEVLDFVSNSDELAGAKDLDAQARLWTGKEAGLKLLGLGLDADAKKIRIQGGRLAFSGKPAEAWKALGSPVVNIKFERVAGAMLAIAWTA